MSRLLLTEPAAQCRLPRPPVEPAADATTRLGTGSASQGGSKRAERFLHRIDDHLGTLPPETHNAFLWAQITGWRERYKRFVLTDGASEPITDPKDPPHASDFLLAITGLEARLKRR